MKQLGNPEDTLKEYFVELSEWEKDAKTENDKSLKGGAYRDFYLNSTVNRLKKIYLKYHLLPRIDFSRFHYEIPPQYSLGNWIFEKTEELSSTNVKIQMKNTNELKHGLIYQLVLERDKWKIENSWDIALDGKISKTNLEYNALEFGSNKGQIVLKTEQQYNYNQNDFLALFDQYAFLSFEKQHRLSTLIEEHSWNMDVTIGEVIFRNDIKYQDFMFPVQYLGTESDISNSWLWADANPDLHCPDEHLQLCREVRAKGAELGLSYFMDDQFEMVCQDDAPDGHMISMVSSCLGDSSCYYRGPYENGAVFFVISNPQIDAVPNLDLNGFREAYSHFMTSSGDMKSKIISYLVAKGYLDEGFDGDKLSCQLNSGEQVEFSFIENSDGSREVVFSADLSQAND